MRKNRRMLECRRDTFCTLVKYVGYGAAILSGWIVFWSELMMGIIVR